MALQSRVVEPSNLLLRGLGFCRRGACEAVGRLKLRASPDHSPPVNDLSEESHKTTFVKVHNGCIYSLER